MRVLRAQSPPPDSINYARGQAVLNEAVSADAARLVLHAVSCYSTVLVSNHAQRVRCRYSRMNLVVWG
jgi:hypothetical protein